MAIKVPIALLDTYDDYVAAFSAGPKGYLYSASTEGGSYSLVTSVALTDGSQGIEYWDANGTVSTWYKHRVGNSAATAFDIELADAVAIQVGAVAGHIDLTTFKLHHEISDGVDDAYLASLIAAANAEVDRRVGFALYPSSDTTRTYDGSRAEADDEGRPRTRLWVPGGIRAFTAVEVKDVRTDASWTAVTTDVRLGPPHLPPGRPYAFVDFYRTVSGSRSSYPDEQANVRVTGTANETFGPEAVLAETEAIATMIVARMLGARDQGQLPDPTPTLFVYPADVALLADLRYLYGPRLVV